MIYSTLSTFASPQPGVNSRKLWSTGHSFSAAIVSAIKVCDKRLVLKTKKVHKKP